MKKLKIIATTLAVVSVLALNPTEANAEWKHDSNGWWNSEGNSWSVGWKKIDEKWYFFNCDGYMQKGWILNNGKWYFLDSNGIMQVGIIQVDGKTYYLSLSGEMQVGNVNLNGETYSFATSGEATGSKIPHVTKVFSKEGVEVIPAKQESKEKEIEISLKGNPTTGCSWEYSTNKDGIIKEDYNEYNPDSKDADSDGSGGTYIWRFSGLKEGSTEITFKYYQPWEKEKVYETKTYTCTVDKDLNITIKEK